MIATYLLLIISFQTLVLNTIGNAEYMKNVSLLLDGMLKGYEKRIRPGFGESPLEVMTDIYLRSMGPISERDMVYSMDCYFRQYWTDKRLSFNGTMESVSLSIKVLDRIWSPDTMIYNGKKSYLHLITTPNKFLRINRKGSVYYSQRLTIRASCQMDLRKYPLDLQHCPLMLGSFGYSNQDVIYKWRYGAKKSVSFAPDMALSQFDLVDSPAANYTSTYKGALFTILSVQFKLQRHTGYFVIHVYLPCCLLVILSWVSFWINREATADRIALGTTTVLTMTFLGLDSRNDLPRVPYITAMDIYVAMCFVFVISTIIQFAAVHYFTKLGFGDPLLAPIPSSGSNTEEEELLPDDSEKAIEGKRIQNGGPHFKVVDAKPSNLKKRPCLKSFWNCLTKTKSEPLYRQRNLLSITQMNSVSKIDRVSRIMFPAVFLMFNTIYWSCYG